jgi:predicted transcriptional regulator
MPMPPPKATTEGPRDRQVVHEMGQLVRALEDTGPCSLEELALLVGARYWEAGRFDRALAFAVADGLVVRLDDGRVQASV